MVVSVDLYSLRVLEIHIMHCRDVELRSHLIFCFSDIKSGIEVLICKLNYVEWTIQSECRVRIEQVSDTDTCMTRQTRSV